MNDLPHLTCSSFARSTVWVNARSNTARSDRSQAARIGAIKRRLELDDVVRILRTDDRELSKQAARAPGEVGSELEIAAARGIRALPPGVADRLHELAGPRQHLGDLFQRQLTVRGLRRSCVVGHRGR